MPTPPTETERRILQLLVRGMTDERAADQLAISSRTLRRRLSEAMGKLGARSRLQAGYLLAKAGWLERDRC